MPNSRNQFTVLLIESNKDVASVIDMVTEQVFPEAVISCASTLEEGVDHLEKTALPPRLVLITSYQRNSDGSVNRLPAFLEHPCVQSRPVLLMEYSDNAEEIRQYYQQGISAYHTKPETYDGWKTLLEIIRQFWFVQARVPH